MIRTGLSGTERMILLEVRLYITAAEQSVLNQPMALKDTAPEPHNLLFIRDPPYALSNLTGAPRSMSFESRRSPAVKTSTLQ